MIKEKDKKIIDDFLKEQNFDFDKYDDFIEYIQARGMLNDDNMGVLDKVAFTKPNLKKVYSEFINPIKRITSRFKLTYKQLAELTGYTESSLNTIASTGAVGNNLMKTLALLEENAKLKEKVKEFETLLQTFSKLLKA